VRKPLNAVSNYHGMWISVFHYFLWYFLWRQEWYHTHFNLPLFIQTIFYDVWTVPVLRIAASRGLSELTKNVIRSSHGHSAPSLKISCKSVQPFSRNLANKETNKDTKIQRNRSKTIPRPPIYRRRGNQSIFASYPKNKLEPSYDPRCIPVCIMYMHSVRGYKVGRWVDTRWRQEWYHTHFNLPLFIQTICRELCLLINISLSHAHTLKKESLITCYSPVSRGVATGVDIGIYTPKIRPSNLFMG